MSVLAGTARAPETPSNANNYLTMVFMSQSHGYPLQRPVMPCMTGGGLLPGAGASICNNQHFGLSDLALLTGDVELLRFLQLGCDSATTVGR
jgi:hypothetical protein